MFNDMLAQLSCRKNESYKMSSTTQKVVEFSRSLGLKNRKLLHDEMCFECP